MIDETIRKQTTPRHVAAKIVEPAVRKLVHGQPVKNVEALAGFENRPELAS